MEFIKLGVKKRERETMAFTLWGWWVDYKLTFFDTGSTTTILARK
jgi:hypothetical protein